MGTETTPFVVRVGDHIEQIAHSFGVPSDAIRSEPANSGLVKKRGSLAMLAAGDILYVPARKRTFLPVTTGSVNKFVAVVPEVEVHLDLTDDKGAIANAAYMVDGAGATIQGTTDGKGHVRLSVPMTARVVRLTLTDSGIAFEISVGGLDPIEETSGVQMRLAHLGFYGGPLDGSLSEHTRAGIKAFQAHEKLTVTGALDDATLSALKDAHGA